MQGFILEVSTGYAGDELDHDQLTGDTVLYITDSEDFDLDGGSVELNGTVYDYTSVDETNLTVTLTTGLVEDLGAGERVNLSPRVEEKWAMVELKEDDDVILALVPHALYDRLDDGVRDPEGQEPVIVEQQEGDWLVADVIGTTPSVSGAYLDPTTVPMDPEVAGQIDDMAAQVAAHDSQITDNATTIENVQETAFQANDLAATADGRISISDYEPSSADTIGRNPGSIWLTRTRARQNLCTNPSFETNLTGWGSLAATMARVAGATTISGTYVAEITNSTAAGEHEFYFDGGAAPLPVQPGQDVTVSVFATLISGSGLGCFARITWLDAANAVLASVDGSTADLPTAGDWTRLSLTATAPDTAAAFTVHFVNPNASDVWDVDGGLVEQADILGRFFDGRSYDASWDGTADASSSSMEGDKITNVFELYDSGWVPKKFMGDAVTDLDASTILRGNMDGERIQDGSIPIDKQVASPVTASVALNAGDFVNIYSDANGNAACKLASSSGDPAHGFVLENVAAGAIAEVYSYGYNPFLSDLNPGIAYLSTAGDVSSSPPSGTGNILQRIGVAFGPTLVNVFFYPPVYIV